MGMLVRYPAGHRLPTSPSLGSVARDCPVTELRFTIPHPGWQYKY